jgi:hypothetical protein
MIQVVTNIKIMMEWKWNDGTHAERSPRIDSKREERALDLHSSTVVSDEQLFVYHTPDISSVPKASVLNENQAYLQSLDMDQQFRESSKKREETWEKIASRDMIGQMGQNPFFYQEGNQNNYVNDVAIRDQFLKPVSTTIEKVKTSDYESQS